MCQYVVNSKYINFNLIKYVSVYLLEEMNVYY